MRLRELLREHAVKYGAFTLTSGLPSPYYIDAKQVTMLPEGASLIGELLFGELYNKNVDAIGGLTLGADAISLAVAAASWVHNRPIPAFVVRKEAKGYGMGKLVEGIIRPGMRVAVVDDVVTSGRSIIQSAHVVRQLGCDVAGAYALVDRFQGAREALDGLGIPFKGLFTVSDLLQTDH